MSLLDDVLAESGASDPEKLVGLWLATQPGIASVGPGIGLLLAQIAKGVMAALASEQDPVVKHDVLLFAQALTLVAQVELVHGAAIVTKLEQWVARQEPAKEVPDAP